MVYSALDVPLNQALESFLQEQNCSKIEVKELSVKQYFEDNEKYPQNRPDILTKLFNALLSIPPSSIKSERAFSTTSFFGTKYRSRMQDEVISALVLLKHHLQK